MDHGGYLIYGSDRPLEARLMVKEHLVSQRLEVAAPFYQACNYVVLFFLSDASPVTLNIGQTHNIYPKCEMSNGSVYGESGSTQWSDYPSIASVSGTGTTRVITGLSPGLTWIDGETTEASDEFCTPMLFRQDQPKEATVNAEVEISNVTVSPTTINTATSPTSATITVSIYHTSMGAIQNPSVTLDVGTFSATPSDNNVSYAGTPATVPVGGSSPATKQFTVSAAPGTTKTGSVIIKATITGTSSNLIEIKNPSPESNAQAQINTTTN